MKAISQKYYDNNRKMYGAETTIAGGNPPKCEHKKLIRESYNRVKCECGVGWIFDKVPEEIEKLLANPS